MKEALKLGKHKIAKIVKGQYLSVLEEKIDQQQQLAAEMNVALGIYAEQIKALEQADLLMVIQATETFNAFTAKIIQAGNASQEVLTFDDDFSAYTSNINDYIDSLPVVVTAIQGEDRFKPGPKDSMLMSIRKRIKKMGFGLSQWPTNIGNIGRKIGEKPVKPPKQWTHKIPLQNLSRFYFQDELGLGLLPLYELVCQQTSINFAQLWYIDEEVDRWATQQILAADDDKLTTTAFDPKPYQESLNEMTASLDGLKKNLQSQLEELLQNIFSEYNLAYDKAGTLELPARRFSPSISKNKHQRLNSDYKKINQGWANTFHALFEGWELDQEMYNTSYLISSQLHLTKQSLSNKISVNVTSEVETLKRFLLEIKGELAQFSGDEKSLKSLLKQKKNHCQNQLKDVLITQTLETLFTQNLANDIDQMETFVKNKTQQLSNKRPLAQVNQYDRIIKSSEIDYISPQELIAFETLPNFTEVTTNLKSQIIKETQEIQLNIRELAQITGFNLGAALSALDRKDPDLKECRLIAEEGLGRAIVKTEEVDHALQNLLNVIFDQMQASILAFNTKLFELTETENVFKVKLRVAKAKAIERSKNIRKKAVENVRNLVPLIVDRSTHYAKQAIIFYDRTKRKYGISIGPQDLSAEVSGFLAKAQAAVQKLPYVYQKLFEIAPLNDDTFFEKRPEEMEKLKVALKNWQQGNSSSVLLIGETGAGTTSLLNHFLKESRLQTKVIRSIPSSRIHSSQDLVKYMGRLLKNIEIKDLNELIDFLNEQEEKKIILLDHLQRFFLRKIDGFANLKLLFELIFKTRENIFWMVTISQYSYDYLNKTLAISDHFPYNIKLVELKEPQITNIILKRHGVSGYKLEFLPAKEDLESKKYQKLSPEAKQQVLKTAYFSRLNKLASSNIGLTLVYWLRSTSEVVGDKIAIMSLKDLDFSFLSSLSSRKIFTLHSILLHDGLTLNEHATVFNQPFSESELMLLMLYEDGIIIKVEDVYKINPLLYRPIVNWLISKNLIH
ncbi:MAG: hypothetical protein DHS20C18_23280 [Saprospiraceae bacterium]|nr:MAG: hypothetical protein DHS20C18_23280 [Saprospiraceae bacterium]